MKKGYLITIAVLAAVCIVQAFALMKQAGTEKELSRDPVADFIDRVQKESRITQGDFDRFFSDDFFKKEADPFKEMESIRKRMRSLMQGHTGNMFDESWDSWFQGRFSSPEITMKTEDTKDAVIMRIHAPGLQQNNLSVDIDSDRVKVECDIKEMKEEQDAKGTPLARYSSQQRVTRNFSLPQNVDASKAVTRREKDEIVITLPKAAGEKRI